MDKARNAVAVTCVLNLNFSTGIVVGGTGILLNNEIDDFSVKPCVANTFGLIEGEVNTIAGMKSPLFSTTPTLVLKNGKPSLITSSS